MIKKPAEPVAPAAAERRQARPKLTRISGNGITYVDYKDIEALRRLTTGNGKIVGADRNNVSAKDQRLISQAIKRARFMALLPYVQVVG